MIDLHFRETERRERERTSGYFGDIRNRNRRATPRTPSANCPRWCSSEDPLYGLLPSPYLYSFSSHLSHCLRLLMAWSRSIRFFLQTKLIPAQIWETWSTLTSLLISVSPDQSTIIYEMFSLSDRMTLSKHPVLFCLDSPETLPSAPLLGCFRPSSPPRTTPLLKYLCYFPDGVPYPGKWTRGLHGCAPVPVKTASHRRVTARLSPHLPSFRKRVFLPSWKR